MPSGRWQERDDIAALVGRSGAVHLFGLSSGGIIVLSAAGSVPGIRSVAVYEPALSVNHSTPLGWLRRYERELALGSLGRSRRHRHARNPHSEPGAAANAPPAQADCAGQRRLRAGAAQHMIR